MDRGQEPSRQVLLLRVAGQLTLLHDSSAAPPRVEAVMGRAPKQAAFQLETRGCLKGDTFPARWGAAPE